MLETPPHFPVLAKQEIGIRKQPVVWLECETAPPRCSSGSEAAVRACKVGNPSLFTSFHVFTECKSECASGLRVCLYACVCVRAWAEGVFLNPLH